MNHIKSISILAGIIVASGFILWSLMRLNEDTGKYDDTQPSIIEEETLEEENKDTQDDTKGENNAIHISEGKPHSDNEGRPQGKQQGEAHFDQDVLENKVIGITEQSPTMEQKRLLNAESDESMQYDTHEHIDMKDENYGIVPERGKTVSVTKNDNTISITIKNKKPVIQQYMLPDRSEYVPKTETDINLQHPTSTSP